MVKLALDRGINCIGHGRRIQSSGERDIVWQRPERGLEEIVLATKGPASMVRTFNRSGATRVTSMREVEGSLRRLQTDYIDLYQVHGWAAPHRWRRPLRTLDDLCGTG